MTEPAVTARPEPGDLDVATRLRLLRGPALLAAGGATAVLALRLRDPHVSGSWGLCPFTYLTGIPCPGCGGLRAVNDLTHGDVLGALSSNAMALALGGLLIVAWVVWTVRRWRGRAVPFVTFGLRGTLVLGGAFVVFGLLRLTPWFAVMRP